MQKIAKRIIQGIVIIGIILVLLVGGLIGIAYVTLYRPADVETIEVEYGATNNQLELQKEYTMTTFNIGYGALGEEQDFFMDGGKNSGALSKVEVDNNMAAINSFIQTTNPDFALLQEVDISGKRSFDVDELSSFRQDDYNIAYGINYDVFFVPVPFTNPHGGAKSGIATLAKTAPINAERYDFAGEEPFPKALFDLQRCFTITRFLAPNNKELVMINAHFSAFDKGGEIRKQQLAQMQQVLIEEQQKGNYVILGSDFNHELPGTSSENFTWTADYPRWCQQMDPSFLPQHYTWAVDGSSPSIRANNKPYYRGENFLATIDGFVVSDNIEIVEVETKGDLDFVNSDHNPVVLKFILK